MYFFTLAIYSQSENDVFVQYIDSIESDSVDEIKRKKLILNAFEAINQPVSASNFDNALLLYHARYWQLINSDNSLMQIIAKDFSKFLPEFEFKINQIYLDNFKYQSLLELKNYLLNIGSLQYNKYPNWARVQILWIIELQQFFQNNSDSEVNDKSALLMSELGYEWAKIIQEPEFQFRFLRQIESAFLYSDVNHSSWKSDILYRKIHDIILELLEIKSDIIDGYDLLDVIEYKLIHNYNKTDQDEFLFDLNQIINQFIDYNSKDDNVLFLYELYLLLHDSYLFEYDSLQCELVRNFLVTEIGNERTPSNLFYLIDIAGSLNELEDYNETLLLLNKNGSTTKDEIFLLKQALLVNTAMIHPCYEHDLAAYNFITNNLSREDVDWRSAISYSVDNQIFHKSSELSLYVIKLLKEIRDRSSINNRIDLYLGYIAYAQFMTNLFRVDDAVSTYEFILKNKLYDFHVLGDPVYNQLDIIYQLFKLYLYDLEDIEKANLTYLSYESIWSANQELLESNRIDIKFDLAHTNRYYMMLSLGEETRSYDLIEAACDGILSRKMDFTSFELKELHARRLKSKIELGSSNIGSALDELNNLFKQNNWPLDNSFLKLKTELLNYGISGTLSDAIADLDESIKSLDEIETLGLKNQEKYLENLNDDLLRIESYYVANFSSEKPDNDLLNQITEFRLKADEFDKYNSRLLGLPQNEVERYFGLLRKSIVSESNEDKLSNDLLEFELFQQEHKLILNEKRDINLAGFQNRLKENQAYIRILKFGQNGQNKTPDRLDEINYAAYIITKNSLNLIELSRKELKNYFNFYNYKLTTQGADELSYSAFFEKLESQLGDKVKEVFIRNDELYNNINIESLWNNERNQYLFEYLNINYVERPSTIFSSKHLFEMNNAMLFGNPNFYGQDNIPQFNKLSQTRSGLNLLPYTKKELDSINEILNQNGIETVTLDYDTANESEFYKNARKNILHIATHGFILESDTITKYDYGILAANSRNTLFTDFNKENRLDGIIFGQEIITQNLTNAEVVVLSACDTGSGSTGFFGGENLANAFLRAGAKNVISTIWPVDDKVTFEFMNEFYRNLMREKNVAESLRQTKLNIKNKYPHPYYWAPFVLTQNRITND